MSCDVGKATEGLENEPRCDGFLGSGVFVSSFWISGLALVGYVFNWNI